MERLFKFSTTVRMMVSLKSRTVGTTLAVMLATTSFCHAQINNTTNAVKEGPAIKKTEINTQKTIPVKTSTIPKNGLKELDKDIVSKLSPGKDLTVVIDNIVDKSTNSDNIYSVHYTLINCGTDDIDITGVVMQGKFSTGQAAGGIALTTNVLNGSPVLKSGMSFKGTMSPSSQELYTNGGPYKYILMADASNKIAESNEKNNTAEVIINAHIPPPAKPKDPNLKPDLIITSLSLDYTERLQVNYTIKNIGEWHVDLKKVNIQGVIELPNNIYVSGGCGAQVYTLAAPKNLNPGESYSSSFSCSSSLTSGQNYIYKLTVSTTVPESVTSNNTASGGFNKP